MTDSDEIFHDHREDPFSVLDEDIPPDLEFEPEDSSEGGKWHHHQHPPVHFVYDAAAERTQQRLKEGHTLLVNGIH